MIYTEQVERSHRFRLALRMGIPIFFLSVITFIAILSQAHEGLLGSFVTLSLIFLGVMVYFIFYLIYQSSNETITDSITHTFTQDYFFTLFNRQKEITTLIMISMENLWLINERYSVKNGDILLVNMVFKIDTFFKEKGIDKIPISRKGSDFFLFLPGNKENYVSFIELFLSKYQNHTDNEIEIRVEAVMVDTRLSDDTETLIMRLHELHHDRIQNEKEEFYSISELENEVIDAIEKKRISLGFWPVFGDNEIIYDTAVKLIDSMGRLIHQSRYVPILNRFNKMRLLESDVLEKLGSLCDGSEYKFSLNISAVTLRNPHFFEHALTLFERYPSAIGKITIFFEEKEYCHQLERFSQLIAHYRKAGYKIGIDKLGAYQSALLYLKEIEVDVVRFDSRYTRHIRESGYQNIIQGLNLSAHLSGAATWIAMIEDEYTDTIVQSLKINYRQGNYLGRILTSEQL